MSREMFIGEIGRELDAFCVFNRWVFKIGGIDGVGIVLCVLVHWTVNYAFMS